MLSNFDDAVGQIYEAAVMPAGWGGGLDLLTQIAGAEGLTIYTESSLNEVRFQASPN